MPLPALMGGFTAGAIYALGAVCFAAAFQVLQFSSFKHSALIWSTAAIGFLSARFLKTSYQTALTIAALAGAAIGLSITRVLPRRSPSHRPSLLYFLAPLAAGVISAYLIDLSYRTGSYSWPSYFPLVTLKLGGHLLGVLDLATLGVSLIILLLAIAAVTRAKRASVGVRAQFALAVAGLLGAASGFFTGLCYPLHPQLNLILAKSFLTANLVYPVGLFRAATAAGIFGLVEALAVAYLGRWASPACFLLLTALVIMVRQIGPSARRSRDLT